MKHKKREHGYIEKRGENRYLVRWRVPDALTGKSKQVSKVIIGDYGRALSFLSEKISPSCDDPSPQVERRTFGSFLDNEWKQRVADKWKGSTMITQGSYVRHHIRPFFEAMLLSEIKPSHIVAFHQAMEAKQLGRKTRRNLHAVITGMFNYALELELIAKSPVKKGIAPKLEHTEKPALDAGQLQQVLSAIPIRYRAYFMTLALTGVRCGEALGLRWEDVDFAGCELHIRRSIYRGKPTTTKTTKSTRPRPMAPQLRTALLAHKAMAVYLAPSDYLFCSSSGRPLNPDLLRKVLHKALAAIGIVFSVKHADGMHLLRHSSGSLVYKSTHGDVKATQQWLGHSSSKITLDTYTHLMAGQEQRSAEAIERAIFAEPEPVPREQAN